MVGLLTNEAALIALSTLRAAVSERVDIQNRVATGFSVASAGDDPTAFLVSQTTTGDLTVVLGVRDNLEIAIQQVATAEAGIGAIEDALDVITDAAVTADNDIALDEISFAVSQQVEVIRAVIENTAFNGANLLSGPGARTVTSGVAREGGDFALDTTVFQALNLGDLTLFGEGTVFTGAPGGFVGDTAREEAQIVFDQLIRTHDPARAFRLFDLNEDGVIDVSLDSPDDFLAGTTGFNFDPDRFESEAALEDAAYVAATFEVQGGGATLGFFLTTPGESTQAIVNIFDQLSELSEFFLGQTDTNGSGVTLLSDTGGSGDDELGPGLDGEIIFQGSAEFADILSDLGFFASFDSGLITLTDPDAPFILGTENVPAAPVDVEDILAGGSGQFTLGPLINTAAASDALLREYANGSGFSGVLDVLDRFDFTNRFFTTEDALVLVDVLRERLNLASATLGTVRATLEDRQNALTDLGDGLSIGIAALIEADLDEDAALLQAAQTREQLALQSLLIANAEPTILLGLFAT